MSEFRQALQDIVADRLGGTGEACRNLADGTEFIAEIEEIAEIVLNTELGRDPREAVILHVADRAAAARLQIQGQVLINLYGQWTKFVVLRRENNPASPQVDFGLRLWTNKDS